MHILVPVKRVVDHNVKIRVKSDGSGVETANVKMSMNPFDEVALEQAVRLKEQGLAATVTAMTCGAAVAQDVLRAALALGADAALLVDAVAVGPLEEARLVAAVAAREQVDLVLCGKQSIDDDLGALGSMVAALLDWPQATSVNRMTFQGGALEVVCEADAGTDRLSLPLPAVVSADLRLCDPRHITLPAMMRAKKAAITTMAAASLADIGTPQVELLAVREPDARAPGVRLEGWPALVERLRAMPALQSA